MKKITCTYNTVCLVSVEELSSIPVLKLDFNIKTFKSFVPGSGWTDHTFPENIMINDKLYLDLETKNNLINLLHTFAQTGELPQKDAQKTSRGFSLLELQDIGDNIISVQASSSAMESKIWFGASTKNEAYVWKNNALAPYDFPPGNILMNDRLHLNMALTKKLISSIEREWNNYMMNNPAPKSATPKLV